MTPEKRMIEYFGRYKMQSGWRWNGFEWVNWRKEKRRKRKLWEMNSMVMKAAGVKWKVFGTRD